MSELVLCILKSESFLCVSWSVEDTLSSEDKSPGFGDKNIIMDFGRRKTK